MTSKMLLLLLLLPSSPNDLFSFLFSSPSLFLSLPLPLSPSVLRVAQCLSSLSPRSSRSSAVCDIKLQLRMPPPPPPPPPPSPRAARALLSNHPGTGAGGVEEYSVIQDGEGGASYHRPSTGTEFASRPWRAPNIQQITLTSVWEDELTPFVDRV